VASISPRIWAKYDTLRAQGYTQAESCRRCGISVPTAWRRESRIREEQGNYSPADLVSFREKADRKSSPADPHSRAYGPGISNESKRGAIPRERLCPEAAKALDDFAFFRRRYFGRRSTPWQEEAAERVKNFLESRTKEYVVINCPPGSGKSTLFTLDIPAWLTCRNRGIRGLMGSASQTLAERYLLRLRNALESPYPMKAESEEMEHGLAFDAETTLLAEYGVFKPEGSVLWTAQAFIVSQLDDRPITEKEPTWSAYGLDTSFIGGRFDFCVWDDATEDKFLQTVERIDKQRDRWDKVAEKRLEPGGLLLLPGQRLSPEDLYRHNLDKRVGSSTEQEHDDCCSALPGRKYHHIVYKAHYEDRCAEKHDPSDPYYPDGCLLDPHRLSWLELESEQENNPGNFMQVYQQEDIDPASALVDIRWIKGGTDPKTKEMFPGCWDDEREVWEIPQLSQPFVSYMCVDPSPTKSWGITLWVYHPKTNLRFLVALHNGKLQIRQFFDWNDPRGTFTGILAEWYERSVIAGFPISTLIFEQNAAQRFFLATDAIKRWQQQSGVRIIGHETHAANKLDPNLGPQILSELYRRGLVRLPGKGDAARLSSMRLVEEVTRYPQFRTDDLVMSQWFGEANMRQIYAREPKLRLLPRPSWMRETA
jgi:transcriptional regulator with XRE-family HTH domain